MRVSLFLKNADKGFVIQLRLDVLSSFCGTFSQCSRTRALVKGETACLPPKAHHFVIGQFSTDNGTTVPLPLSTNVLSLSHIGALLAHRSDGE